MALGLAGEKLVKRPGDALRPRGAQKVAQLHFLVVAQTAIDSARGRDPDAVAAFAEILREGGDETETDAEPFHFIIAAGPPVRASDGVNRNWRPIRARTSLSGR